MKFGTKKKDTVLDRSAKKQVKHLYVPGKAFAIEDPSAKLINVVGSFFNEPTYYGEGGGATGKDGLTEQARIVVETAKAVAQSSDPEDLFVIASWCRDRINGLKQRSTPQVLLAVAASEDATRPLLSSYESQVIQRADEIKQVFGAYRTLFQSSGSLPHALRRALAKALSRFSDYQLIKYDSKVYPTFVDVLNMVGNDAKFKGFAKADGGFPISKGLHQYLKHGKVSDSSPEIVRARDAFFRRTAIKGVTLEDVEKAGLTWENLISHFGASKDAWELVIPVMGEMALVRNLRNFEEHKIGPAAWDKVYETLQGVEKTNQLPFRFFTAEKATTSTESKTVVGIMLDKAVASLRDLPGTTVVLVDNSGSAQGARISDKSNLTISDCGNMLAAVLAKRLGRRATVGIFGDALIWVPFSQADSTLSIKKLIDQEALSGERDFCLELTDPRYGSYFRKGTKGVGGATETGLWWAFKDLTERKVHVDRFILLSDLCCYTQGDVNCGINMKQYFGANSSVDGMVEKYRAAVNKGARCFSVSLAGYSQAQVNPKGSLNFVMSGWSEKIVDLIADTEGTSDKPSLPTIEVLRTRYGRKPFQSQQGS